MKTLLAAICAAGFLLGGCGENPQEAPTEVREAVQVRNTITIQINGKEFTATLENKRSARAFAERLPLEVDATELNGNEKYFYLDDDLPTDAVRINQIHAGDLMLYESNCVVLFYRDFTTSYSYTRLGKLDNPAGLASTVGDGNVHIKFEE